MTADPRSHTAIELPGIPLTQADWVPLLRHRYA